MAKLYDSKPPKHQLNSLEPKTETIQRILGFSKALSISRYKNMTFETINN